MLDIRGINVGGDSASLIMKADLKVGDGEIAAVLGRNGTGKTTLLHCIMGLQRISAGEIWVNNTRVDELDAHRVARLGVGYAAQKHGLFLDLTVDENLRVGNGSLNSALLKGLCDRFPVVRVRSRQKARTLSGGEAQQVKLVRAVLRARELLLLDEIAQGVNEELLATFVEVIREAAQRNKMPVLLVEQRRRFAEKVAHRKYELLDGRLDQATEPVAEFRDLGAVKAIGIRVR